MTLEECDKRAEIRCRIIGQRFPDLALDAHLLPKLGSASQGIRLLNVENGVWCT